MSARVLLYWDYELGFGYAGAESRRIAEQEALATDRLLDFLQARGVPATFAVVGACAMLDGPPHHNRSQVARMAEQGHEVASHGWQHERFSALAPDRVEGILRRSRFALEQATGNPVVSFAGPWNSPQRWLARGAFALGEKRRHGALRTDIPVLLRCLRRAGYRTARVYYQPTHLQVLRRMGWRSDYRGPDVLHRNGLTLLRSDFPQGFDVPSVRAFQARISAGRIGVVWGHPWRLLTDSPEAWRFFEPMMDRLCRARDVGQLKFATPRDFDSEAARKPRQRISRSDTFASPPTV